VFKGKEAKGLCAIYVRIYMICSVCITNDIYISFHISPSMYIYIYIYNTSISLSVYTTIAYESVLAITTIMCESRLLCKCVVIVFD